MRIAKGKRITRADRGEIAQFERFLSAVSTGTSPTAAYAHVYGEVVFERGNIPEPKEGE